MSAVAVATAKETRACTAAVGGRRISSRTVATLATGVAAIRAAQTAAAATPTSLSMMSTFMTTAATATIIATTATIIERQSRVDKSASIAALIALVGTSASTHDRKMSVVPIDRRLYFPIPVPTPTVGDGRRTVGTTDMFL